MAPQTHQIGRIRTHLISDGIFWTDGGGAFGVVPRLLWEKTVQPDPLNRIPMQLRCLLIESRDGLILVDTGYGDKLPAKMRRQLRLKDEKRLLSDLALLGYRPEDVNLVINTHLHGDHCGGNTAFNTDGRVVPTFPNAAFMVQRLELADAIFPDERTRHAYFGENFLPLTGLCQEDASALRSLRMLNGDTQITEEVRTLVTPGHTRAHQVVIIESQGETAVFLADAAAWAVSLERLPWVPAFDTEPLLSMETKRSLRDWALRRNALLFFQHDIVVSAGRVCQEAEQWHVEPEP